MTRGLRAAASLDLAELRLLTSGLASSAGIQRHPSELVSLKSDDWQNRAAVDRLREADGRRQTIPALERLTRFTSCEPS